MGIACHQRPLTGPELGQERHYFASRKQLEYIFSGPDEFPDPNTPDRRSQICLHQSHDVTTRLRRPAFDVDSFIHVTRSLLDFKGTLLFQVAPQRTKIINKSIHIKLPVHVWDETAGMLVYKNLPPKDIPHMLFATDEEKNSIFAFFPYMYQARNGQPKVNLTDRQHKLFFEHVVSPALQSQGAQVRHHIPGTYGQVVASSRVGTELTGSSTGRGSPVEIPVNQSYLPRVWRIMEALLDLPENPPEGSTVEEQSLHNDIRGFREPIFIYDCKNTKLHYQTADQSLASTINSFWQKKSSVVLPHNEPASPRRPTQQYLDIASELIPSQRGRTLLARRCCQHNTMMFIRGQSVRASLLGESHREPDPGGDDPFAEDPPDEGHDDEPLAAHADDPRAWQKPRSIGAIVTEYPIHLLRDAVSITMEPRPASASRQAGLVYGQSYTIEEGIFNHIGIMPFSHGGIVQLGLDPGSWDMYARAGKIKYDRSPVYSALDQSCRRMTDAYSETLRSYGWRVEFRVDTRLSDQIILADEEWAQMTRRAQPEPSPDPLAYSGGDPSTPPPRQGSPPCGLAPQPDHTARAVAIPDTKAFFAIPAQEFNRFVRTNINKYVYVMDAIQAYYARDEGSVPIAAAALHSLMVVCLQHFISHLTPNRAYKLNNPLEPAAVQQGDNPQDNSRGNSQGLGIGLSMSTRGFGFLPRGMVDWQTFKVSPEFVTQIMQHTVAEYRRQTELRALTVQHTDFDRLMQMTTEHVTNDAQANLMYEAITQFLIQEFRTAAAAALFPGLSRAQRRGLEFTLQGIRALSDQHGEPGPVPALGNKAAFKQPLPYFRWLWLDDSIKFSRRFLETLGFRQYFQRAYSTLSSMDTPSVSPARFVTVLYYRFFQQHSAFPYPNSNGTLSQTAKYTRERVVLVTQITRRNQHIQPHASLRDQVAVVVRRRDMTLSDAGTSPALNPQQLQPDRILQRLRGLSDAQTVPTPL